ncbi:MAG: c-type cytochrome [Bacillota bacterium]
MKAVVLWAAAAALALAGCGQEQGPAKTASTSSAQPDAQKASLDAPAGNIEAGKKIAEAECKGCHGLDGKGVAPAIPRLSGQSERYLLAALNEYRERKRMHAVLREIATSLKEADLRNVAAFYASLPASGPASGAAPVASPYEQGKAVAARCATCHGDDGNGKIPGTPSLAGQQPRYLTVAINEYLNGERKTSPMHAKLRGMGKLDVENVALFFASQQPATRTSSPIGDPKAGEPLSAVCGGCHGAQGISGDSATPSLAGQDERYLVEAIKAYRTSRKRDNMRIYITGLSDKDIQNIAAFYAVQRSRAPEKGQTLVQEYIERCDRCHAPGVDNPAMAIPRIQGQDKDYLVMALRAYRDDRRASSTMHNMSLPYGDSFIESIATYYASQPAK